MTNVIIYEQPLNEIFRVCLRFEYLFTSINHYLDDHSFIASRNIITTIINIMNLLDRPDLKTKLAKELTQLTQQLLRLENAHDMDKSKLYNTVDQLNELSNFFINNKGKIAYNLYTSSLLNNLRLHIITPGGGLNFDVPVYHYWLNQPDELRLTQIKEWLKEFDQIITAVTLLLKILRQSAKLMNKIAENGFYQELLDSQQRLSLIRITVPKEVAGYPEISVSRHFVSIRFFIPEISSRPLPCQTNINFGLAYCSIAK